MRTLGDAGRRLEFIARQHPYLGDNGTGELQHYDAFGSYERLSLNRCLHARVYSITVHMTRNVEAPRALRHGAHATCAVDEPRGHHALGDAPGAEARMPRDSTRSRSLESPPFIGTGGRGQVPGAGALFAGDRALERAAVTAGQHACLVLVSCGQDRSEDPFSITYVLPQHRSLSTCLATTRESQRILRLRAGKRGRRRLGFGNRTAAAGADTCARRGTVLTWRACPVPRAPRGRGLRWRGESSRLVGLLGFHLYLKNTPRATAFT